MVFDIIILTGQMYVLVNEVSYIYFKCYFSLVCGFRLQVCGLLLRYIWTQIIGESVEVGKRTLLKYMILADPANVILPYKLFHQKKRSLSRFLGLLNTHVKFANPFRRSTVTNIVT